VTIASAVSHALYVVGVAVLAIVVISARLRIWQRAWRRDRDRKSGDQKDAHSG
jgi:hypothetical protein